MKTAVTTLLHGKVHGLVFVAMCLVLGGLVTAAVQMAWNIQDITERALQDTLMTFPSLL